MDKALVSERRRDGIERDIRPWNWMDMEALVLLVGADPERGRAKGRTSAFRRKRR